jgi:hypothetical protein
MYQYNGALEDQPRPCDIFPSRVERLVANKMAVLVIDVQNWTMDKAKFTQMGDYFFENARANVIPNIKRILEAARRKNVEVEIKGGKWEEINHKKRLFSR